MKISYNWLKDYISIDLPPVELGAILTDIGLEVEKIESFESIKGGLEGVVIGVVKSCSKHPNADKLSLTTVDIGKNELVQIVCGAPNVAEGQTVVVATVGATIYPLDGAEIKIKKAKIRGELSEGMICAEDELGLGTSHEGILVLEDSLSPGTPAAEYFYIENDTVFEIGLTPNRGDAASHFGVVRDLKAALKKDVTWPSVDQFGVNRKDKAYKVSVETEEGCPRFSGVGISNLKVEESPDWLKNRLSAIGLTPINNVVDITNYVLHETGQPLHAYDAAHIPGNEIIVKTMPDGTKFTTLDEKERRLKDFDVMVCNTKGGMCIGGVFGGIESGVTSSTTEIFLEAAYFTPDHIRRTSQYHGLKTDASFRFERGTDPAGTVYAIKRAALLMQDIAGGTVNSDLIDLYPNQIKNIKIEVSYTNINRLIGIEVDKNRVIEILENLNINIEKKTDKGFLAIVPLYKVDVTREADIIEEILRIYGFNNVPLPSFIGSSFLAEHPVKDPDSYRNKISQLLVGKGWYEILTNSLTKPDYVSHFTELDQNRSVDILNKLSEDLAVMRQSMLFTGLESVVHNINRRNPNLKFFEFGKVYQNQNGEYLEHQRMAFFITGAEEDNWRNESRKYNIYDLIGAVKNAIGSINNTEVAIANTEHSGFANAVDLSINEESIGFLGSVSPKILKAFELNQEIFYSELDWSLLLNLTSSNIVYAEVPKFPAVKRDLSLVIDTSITFDRIEKIASKVEPKLLSGMNVFDVYEGERIGAGKKAYAVSFILQDQEKTLTDKVIDKTMNKLMQAFETEAGALIRQ